MTDLLRRNKSPVSKARSPAYETYSRGKEYLGSQARISPSGRNKRNVSPSSKLLGANLSNAPLSSDRSRSSERQGHSKKKLDIPRITVTEVSSSSSLTDLSSNRNTHSDLSFDKPRCRSASPFNWIEREKLPCGSPTFERVRSDMLSDSESSPMNSDAEERNITRSVRVKKKMPKTAQTNSYYLKNRGKFKF